jgi:hypothetical protein
MNNNLTELIYNAYAVIGRRTPIRADCGKLCGKACCKSDKSDDADKAGMLLFPGEEYIYKNYENVSGFRFRIEEIEYMDVPGIKLLICEGRCSRNLRPLSCRIFPVAPDIGDGGTIGIQADIRGRRICPIWDLEYVDKSFTAKVEKAFALLAENDEMLSFMRLISSDVKFIRSFFE